MISIFLWELLVVNPYKPNLLFKPNTGFLSNRLEDLENTSDVDILVLGSSKAYRGLDPRIFSNSGYKLFNLGSSAQTHIQTNYFLKKYLSQLNPRLIIYEVYPDTFIGEGIESGINVISSAPVINSDLIEFVWDMNNVKTYNTFLIKMTRNSLGLSRGLQKDNISDKYISGGYVEHFSTNDSLIYLPTEKWIPNSTQIEKFEENLEIIKSYNIPYILVLTPYTKNYENLEQIEWYLEKQGEFINLNKKLNFSVGEHFYDGQHLNQKGVNILNAEVIKIIESKFPIIKNQ